MRAGAKGAAAPAPDAHTIKLVIAAGFGSILALQREVPPFPPPFIFFFPLPPPGPYRARGFFRHPPPRRALAVSYKPVVLTDVFAATGGLPLAKRHAARQRYRMVELQR